MKKYIDIFWIFLVIGTASIIACKKTPVGYLSENLRYMADTLVIFQGQTLTSNGVVLDNSTPPLKVRLLNVRNKATGKREEAFFKQFKVAIWKSAFNPLTDTTEAIIKSKRDTVLKTPLTVLESSGQFVITNATENIAPGYYLVDLEVENPNGTKTFMGICTIKLNKSIDYEYTTVPYFIAVKAGTETGIRFTFDDQWINSETGQGTTVDLKIRRVADFPNQVVLKILDKNGAVFPGKALENRPNGNAFFNNLRTFAYKTTVTDTAILYDYFASTRFPDPYWDDKTNGILCYYRMYDKYIASIDTADTKKWFPPVQTPYGTYIKQAVSANIRFSTKINRPGKYIYEMKLKVTKK